MFNVKRVSRAFLFSSEIVSSSIAYICPGTLYCLVVFVNWNGHCGKLPRAAFCGKLVQSIEGADCTRAAVEYRPLSLFITVNSTVKSETIITTA